MSARSKARLVGALGSAVLAVLLGAGFWYRYSFSEWWYLRKFDSGLDPEKASAAVKLSQMRSGVFLRRLRKAGESLIADIRTRGVSRDAPDLKYLFLAGVAGYPEVFRAWVETFELGVLVLWEGHIRSLTDGSVDMLFPGRGMSINERLSRDHDFVISREWGSPQGRMNTSMLNPINPFERVFGPGTWPADLPRERLQDPRAWKSRTLRERAAGEPVGGGVGPADR